MMSSRRPACSRYGRDTVSTCACCLERFQSGVEGGHDAVVVARRRTGDDADPQTGRVPPLEAARTTAAMPRGASDSEVESSGS